MSKAELQIEWLFVNLRWFFLIAVASVIGLEVVVNDSAFPDTVVVLLVVGSIANIVALISLLQSSYSKAMQYLLLVLDVALTLGLIGTAEGMENQLLFVSLIPITTAAMRISQFTGIVMMLGIVVSYWLMAFSAYGINWGNDRSSLLRDSLPLLTNGFILIVAGTAVTRIGVRIKQSLQRDQERRQELAVNEIRTARRKTRLVFELAGKLSATLNYEYVLDAALDVSSAGMQQFANGKDISDGVGLILLYGFDQTLYVARSRRISVYDERLRLPAEQGALAEAIKSNKPVVVHDPAEDPELNRISAVAVCQEAVVVPLNAGMESYGVLVLGSTTDGIYNNDFLDLLNAICNQAVMALQNARLYQNLMDEKDRLVTVEEDARKKLARDLHDGPTQTIASIAMRLNYIRMLVEKRPKEAITELQELEDMARLTTKEIRQMLFTLRPLILESQGLIAALEQLRNKIMETTHQKIKLEMQPEAESGLSKEAKGSLFYIVEEACTNARKHAKADLITIRLYRRGMNIITEITDDGVGFDVSETESDYASRGSLGMVNMRERATLVQGKTVIRSAPGKGTTISISIPAIDKPVETEEDETDEAGE